MIVYHGAKRKAAIHHPPLLLSSFRSSLEVEVEGRRELLFTKIWISFDVVRRVCCRCRDRSREHFLDFDFIAIKILIMSSTEDEKTTSDASAEAPKAAEEPKKEGESSDEEEALGRVPSDTEVRFKAHAILSKVENAENKRLSADDLKAKEEAAKREDEAVAAAATEMAKQKKEREIESKKKEASDALTKRMQKLALDIQERQKNNTDRLRVIQSDQSSHLSSAKTFQDLNLPEHLLKAIFEMGFERPSAIQEEALPRILANPPRNLIGQAQSGSGKTAAFVLGMLYRIKIDTPATCQALCVTPTRELAVQIFNNAVSPMAAHMSGLKVRLALSGETIERGSKLDSHIVIGTPGKIVDWLKRRIIDARTIKVFVLDEADNMVAESGHRANSLLIKKVMSKKCQSLLFSATFPDEVITFAEKMIHNPDKILIESDEYLVRCLYRFCYLVTLQYVSLTRISFPLRIRYLILLNRFGLIVNNMMVENCNFWKISTHF